MPDRSTNEFIAGTFGGFTGKIVEYPLDTVKVLMQTQDVKRPKYTSSLQCFRSLIAENGASSVYRGVAGPLLGSMAEISTLMTTYGAVKRLLGEEPGERQSTWKRTVAGACAGVTVSCVLTPVELIKCRLQVSQGSGSKYKGTLDCITRTIGRDGIGGLFRGNASTLMREIPGNIAWFGMYEFVCNCFRQRQGDESEELHPSVYILAGASAGVGYWTAFFPADVVKSRIQTGMGLEGLNPNKADTGPKLTPGAESRKPFINPRCEMSRGDTLQRTQKKKPSRNPPTFWRVFNHVAKTEGVRGLYNGWGITVLRAAPSNAAVFFAYEMCMQALGAEKEGVRGHPAADSRSSQDLLDATVLQTQLAELKMELRDQRELLQKLERHLTARDAELAETKTALTTCQAELQGELQILRTRGRW